MFYALGAVVGAAVSAAAANAVRAESIEAGARLYGIKMAQSRVEYERELIAAREKAAYDSMMRRIRDKDQNMSTRLDRRREAIWRKWGMRCTAMVVAPLVIALIAACWRLAAWAIAE